ncbi:MFS general substrate transporter, partial [Aureobasidium melanogenum]
MITQDFVSNPDMSQSSAEDATIRPQDVSTQVSSFDDTEKTSSVPHVSVQSDSTGVSESRHSGEENPMAATAQVTNPAHPHGLKLAAIVIALCLATLLAALDQTIMATAAPKITDHFKSIDDIGCSLVCATAPSSNALIVGRAIAGVGVGGLFTGSLSIIFCCAPLQRRPAIMGIVSSMWGVASAAGPLLGGVFTDKVSWRWCFYINLPIGALTIVMIAFLLRVPRLDNAEQLPLWQRIKKLDLIGASLLIPATVCLLLALQWGGSTYSWNDPRMIALFVVGGVLTVAFIYSQSKLGSKATLPPYLFKNRNTLCYYTPFIIGCMALFACGAGLLTTLSITTPYRDNLGFQILAGFGVGIGFEGGIIAVQTVLSGRDIPVAISVVSFFMTIGGAIFVPISQTIFQNGFLAAIKILAPQLDGHVFLKGGATRIRAILSMMDEEKLLECESWIFDGVFRKKVEFLRVAWPSGLSLNAIPVVNLEVFPLRFGGEELKERLKQRGQTLWDCRFKKYVSYENPFPTPDMQTRNLRFMVDMPTYNLLHSKATDEKTWTDGDSINPTDMKAEESPGDDFLLTLPAKVKGFGFHNKRWIDLLLRNIKEVPWDKNAFQNLVMDEQKKSLLEALVVVQGDRSQNNVPDIIEGKGNGLILLLHGPPGTGKTLTAESVAERAHKPLYRVTCGDIRTHTEDIEASLDSVLFIGKTWDCVVLLDEADIFLEERSPSDLERNALVSIFLRVLEYYDGILILTTNRVGTFDEAFKSRIRLAVHYPSLKRSDREQIWKMILDSIEGEVKVTNSQLFMLAKHPLDGRQIRNAIKTASQQASYQKSCLTYGHLQTAIDVANEFEEYICKVRGQTDDERAVDNMARAAECREE